MRNVFEGNNAVLDFLNPDNNPYIPLVEMPDHLNPFANDGVRVFLKLMNMLPLGNVKSLPALNMLLEAKNNNQLESVHTVIENSSGNTVFSLATIARLLGIEKTIAIVSHEVSWGKLQLLRLLGTDIVVNEESICPDPHDKNSGIYKAKQQGMIPGFLNPGQYDNEANPRAHEQWTAPQIWEQTEGNISIFCAGVGTTGTMVGVGGYLKKKSSRVVTVGVARAPNNPVPGVRTQNLLREIAFDWRSVTDHIEEVGTATSFICSLDLCRAGLLVGPSSGFAVAGLFQFLEQQKKMDNLASLKNSGGDIVAVCMCPDGPLPYLSEYFDYLDESYFPAIVNEGLLINKPNRHAVEPIGEVEDVEIEISQLFEQLYRESPSGLWESVNAGRAVSAHEQAVLIDVRTREEFEHAHAPGSEHCEHTTILENSDAMSMRWKSKKVFALCRSGKRSELVAQTLRIQGIEAYSVRGGMIEWSRLNLPRIRPDMCSR